MTDDAHNVDWNLLPHSPHAFFGIGKEFDRKELKRQYNLLIRQFKPEKHSAEFQRIRAAYELLDNQLRYGTQVTMPANMRQTYEWQTDESPVDAKAGEQRSSQPTELPTKEAARQQPKKTPSLQELLTQQPLAEVYQQLAKKPDKRPFDFYALAVMSDIVEKEKLHFANWILKGLAACPGDRGLMSLLYEYLRGPVPEAVMGGMLIATSKAVPNDRFYALTESLWQRFLRAKSFREFRATLEKCEANLRDVNIDCRLAFSIEILKSAIWSAEVEWIEQIMLLIDENFERIPYHVQYDIDILQMLKRYIDQRSKFLSGHPMRQTIDRALRAYFMEDQAEGDREIIACQVQIAADPAGVLAAFPVDSEEDYSNLYILWNYAVGDVAERNLLEPPPQPDLNAWISRGRALYERIERSILSSKVGIRLKVIHWLYLIAVATTYVSLTIVLAVIVISIMLDIRTDWVAVLAVLAAVGGGWYLARLLTKRLFRPLYERYMGGMATLCYQESSRIELAEFMQRSQFGYQQLKHLLFNCNITGLNTAQSTADHFQQDYGLGIYSMSLPFVV
jgi:hypothetical protein